jgi:hypothetical protein
MEVRKSRTSAGSVRKELTVIALMVSVIVLSFFAVASAWLVYNPDGLSRDEAMSGLVDAALQVLLLSAVAGFAAMATIEMAKRLLHWRGAFFHAALVRYGSGTVLVNAVSARPLAGEMWFPRRSGPWRRSARAIGAWSRLDIPIEQLVAQLGHAVDAALAAFADPPAAPSGRRRPDGRLGGTRRGRQPPPSFRSVDHAAAQLLVALVWRHGDGSEEALTDADPIALRTAALAALDDLQVSIGNSWRWRLRSTSCGLAAAYAVAALVFLPAPPLTKILVLASSLVLGGFFAGLFRDAVAVLERARRI